MWMNERHDMPAGVTWLDSLTAVRSEKLSRPMAMNRMTNATIGFSSSWGWPELVEAFVEREQAAHAEQHEGDDECPEVALRGRSRTDVGR